MATASDNPADFIEVMEDDLSCNICYNLLRQPKDLDCPHVFCLQCLQKWVKKGKTVECPECRHITIVPHGGLVNLKTNLRLKSMVEKYSERVEQQKSVPVPVCSNHKGEKQHFFCVTCGVSVCRDCLVLQHPISQHEIEELKVITTVQKEEMKAEMGYVEKEMKKIEDDAKILDEIERQLQAATENAEKDVRKRVQEAISEVENKGQK
ncbi:tripartite motif-containing protein 3-like [Amphiura filiformis]|uniref:tripartite motif-containing protein 3-like n=1 Tax=Amphiura filiformis TaxID=82378 RepID=UPI003B21D928